MPFAPRRPNTATLPLDRISLAAPFSRSERIRGPVSSLGEWASQPPGGRGLHLQWVQGVRARLSRKHPEKRQRCALKTAKKVFLYPGFLWPECPDVCPSLALMQCQLRHVEACTFDASRRKIIPDADPEATPAEAAETAAPTSEPTELQTAEPTSEPSDCPDTLADTENSHGCYGRTDLRKI